MPHTMASGNLCESHTSKSAHLRWMLQICAENKVDSLYIKGFVSDMVLANDSRLNVELDHGHIQL